jgi:hypothetical protein
MNKAYICKQLLEDLDHLVRVSLSQSSGLDKLFDECEFLLQLLSPLVFVCRSRFSLVL